MSLENIIKNIKNTAKIAIFAIPITFGSYLSTGCDQSPKYEPTKTVLIGEVVNIKYDVQEIGGALKSKTNVVMRYGDNYFHFSAEGNGQKDNPERAELYEKTFQEKDSVKVLGNVGYNDSEYLKKRGIEGKNIYWQKAWEIKDHKEF